jgi:hypothetical protein
VSITLKNATKSIAQYVVKKGDQVVARLPGIEPGSSITVPTTAVYQITASTILNNNTYKSTPIDVTGSAGFLAQVLQVPDQGTFTFDVQESPIAVAGKLVFQKTSINPVTFTISKDGKALQNVVVNDSYTAVTLNIGDTYYIYAVVNGVTSSTISTGNPNATVTAIEDTSDLEEGYFTLQLN